MKTNETLAELEEACVKAKGDYVKAKEDYVKSVKECADDLVKRVKEFADDLSAKESYTEVKSSEQIIVLCMSRICYEHFSKAVNELEKQIALFESCEDFNDDESDMIDELSERISAAEVLRDLCKEIGAFRYAAVYEDNGMLLSDDIMSQMESYLADDGTIFNYNVMRWLKAYSSCIEEGQY